MLLQLAAPPSFPADVRVFSGSESATVSWSMPNFVQSFFGKCFIFPVLYYIVGKLSTRNNFVTLNSMYNMYIDCEDLTCIHQLL